MSDPVELPHRKGLPAIITEYTRQFAVLLLVLCVNLVLLALILAIHLATRYDTVLSLAVVLAIGTMIVYLFRAPLSRMGSSMSGVFGKYVVPLAPVAIGLVVSCAAVYGLVAGISAVSGLVEQYAEKEAVTSLKELLLKQVGSDGLLADIESFLTDTFGPRGLQFAYLAIAVMTILLAYSISKFVLRLVFYVIVPSVGVAFAMSSALPNISFQEALPVTVILFAVMIVIRH